MYIIWFMQHLFRSTVHFQNSNKKMAWIRKILRSPLRIWIYYLNERAQNEWDTVRCKGILDLKWILFVIFYHICICWNMLGNFVFARFQNDLITFLRIHFRWIHQNCWNISWKCSFSTTYEIQEIYFNFRPFHQKRHHYQLIDNSFARNFIFTLKTHTNCLILASNL